MKRLQITLCLAKGVSSGPEVIALLVWPDNHARIPGRLDSFKILVYRQVQRAVFLALDRFNHLGRAFVHTAFFPDSEVGKQQFAIVTRRGPENHL